MNTDYKQRTYNNGYPFTGGEYKPGVDLHAHNLNLLRQRVENRKATLIIVDGGLGEGKTTLAVHLADYYQGKTIDFKEQVFMGGEQFLKGMKVCYEKKLVVAVYDEGGDYAKRGALSRLNKMMGRLFDIFRAFQIIVIVVLPSFLVLDNELFDKNVPRMLIHCHGRTKNQGGFSVYDLTRMMYIREYAKKAVIKSDAFKRVQPNYRGHFLDLAPGRSRELDKYSTGGKLEVVDLAEIKGSGLSTYADMASRIGRSHEWVRRKVSELGVEHSKLYKGKKYFSEEVFNAIKRSAK